MALKRLVLPKIAPPFVRQLRYTNLLNARLPIYTFSSVTLVKQTTGSGHPFYDIFVQQKVPLLKISDDVIACDRWFGPPNQKLWLRLWGLK